MKIKPLEENMPSVNITHYQITDAAMSKVIDSKQSPILEKIPNKIGDYQDIYRVKTKSRNKPKSAAILYKKIKEDFLFKLDEMLEFSSKDIQKIKNILSEYLSDKTKKKDIKASIKTVKKSKESVDRLVIQYDKFSWFKDPNLLSTIRFHQKLNEISLSRAEKSLEYHFDKSKIDQYLEEALSHPEYIKAIIVVTFQPILTYGAIYASTKFDYDYIIKYESIVSEAAEKLFNANPALKTQFFSKLLA